jgi:RNase P subunit RPR2
MVWFGASIVVSIRSERFAHAPYTCPECRTQIPTTLDGQTKRYYCSRCEVIWDTRVRKYDGNWD